MTEAELLANLPAEGVRVFKLNATTRLHAVSSDAKSYWASNRGKPWSGPYDMCDDDLSDYVDPWTEVTPAPSLRDQRIAEGFAKWADGRMFEDASEPNQLELRMCVNGIARFTARHKQDWHAEENDPTSLYESANHWHEIPRPAAAPTLPDPSGDLPDGTRVRVTYEGAVERWDKGDGFVRDDNGTWAFRIDVNTANPLIKVEVLSLPTPLPSALGGEPGSLWRDPETGTLYARKQRDAQGDFVRLTWDPFTVTPSQMDGRVPKHAPLIARLVPAEVAK